MTENRKRISVTVRKQSGNKEVKIEKLPVRIVNESDPYTGAYTVDPLFSEQTLLTNGKRMTDNVTVLPIYMATTHNPQGGNTVYIGGEYRNA